MVRIGHSLLALTLALSTTAACKKKQVEPTVGSGSDTTMAGSAETGSAMPTTGSGSAAGSGSDTGSGSAGSAGATGSAGSAGSAAMTGSGSAAEGTSMTNKGGNCPSLVFGATTTAKVEKDTVVVSVTSTDKDAVMAIQNRAKALIKEKAEASKAGGGHDQKGTQGGVHGICPIYFSDGTGTATYDAKGTTVRMVPKAGTTADDLKKKIDERIAKSADWVKANVKEGDKGTTGGVGGGAGKHGSVHAGSGDGKGKERKDGTGGGKGTGGGGGQGGGSGSGAKK